MNLWRAIGWAACMTLTSVLCAGCPASPDLFVIPTFVDLGANDVEGTFRIGNSGGGQIFWFNGHSTNWISSVSPSSGFNEATVTVTINRNRLMPGANTGTITVTTSEATIDVTIAATDATSYDLREYWPFAVGNSWTWALAGDPTDTFTTTIVGEFLSPQGYEVWHAEHNESTKGTITDVYYVYVNGILYSTTSPDIVGDPPDISEDFTPLYEEDLSPGTSARDFLSGEIVELRRGSLSSFLPITRDGHTFLLDDFAVGNQADCIAASVRVPGLINSQRIPLRIFARGLGPVLDNERVLQYATIDGAQVKVL